MNQDVKEIEDITFSVYSKDEIEKMAVCKIDNTKRSDPGSVYDERMGTLDNTKQCVTCLANSDVCVGHFGYIALNEAIVHPLYYKQVISFFKCFCTKCNKLLLLKDQIYLNGLNKYKGNSRFLKILEKIEKVDICCQDGCNNNQPEIKHNVIDGVISMIYTDTQKNKVTIALTVDEIKKTFENVTNEDVELLGFNPKLVHPRNFIMTNLLVLPPADRPFVKADGNICDDDITNQYCLHHNTEVILWNGDIKMACDIIPGDKLIGDDGKMTTVLDVCEGFDELFEVRQQNGDNYIVNSKHKLTLKFSGHKTIFYNKSKDAYQIIFYDVKKKTRCIRSVCLHENKGRKGEIRSIDYRKDLINDIDTFDISIEEYMKMNISTQKMFKGIKCPLVNWEKKEVLIDPYILGMWLGDGSSRGNGFSSNDHELVHKWVEWARSNNAEVYHTGSCSFNIRLRGRGWKGKSCVGSFESSNKNCKGCSKKISYACSSDEELEKLGIKRLIKLIPDNIYIKQTYKKGDCINPLKVLLKKYNLVSSNYKGTYKHIPQDYIINDRETRLNLLAGLIDTNGILFGKGSISITQAIPEHQNIIDGIITLVRSLGFSCFITEELKYGKIGLYKKLVISGDHLSDIPIILDRKKQVRNNKKNVLTTGISIIPFGKGKYNGFKVDNTNNRFLLKDFTITHNCEIIKANNHLGDSILSTSIDETNRQKYIQTLKFRILTLFNNSSGRASHTTNGRPIKGIKERITGKEGQIRNNIMGKRCNQSARTVIGPDPTLKLGELAVPREMAEILTVPVKVAPFNIEILTQIVNSGRANYVLKNNGKTRINLERALFRKGTELLYGDIIYRQNGDQIRVETGKERLKDGDRVKRNEEFLVDLKYPTRREYKLEIGDIVERKLMNRDIVLLNRQPTLKIM
jgi:hypothetical protein